MKPLNESLSESEIENIVLELQKLLDSKVQRAFLSLGCIGFELFKASKISYLWIELNPIHPVVQVYDKLPKDVKLLKTAPMLLFLKAHLIGKRLSEILHIKEQGRVIEFRFGYDDPLKLEVSLYPHGVKAVASFDGKVVTFRPTKASSQKEPAVVKEKQVEKKRSALAKAEIYLEELQNDLWGKIGEWLKQHQTLDVPQKYVSHIDKKKTFAQNIQACFEKSKKNQEKLNGTLERIEILKNEISKLQEAELSEFTAPDADRTKSKKPDNWKGYRLNLNPQLEVFVGKSAQENLTVLRYAQSWDYWMHIKDYPGAHGIIRRPRNYQISEEEFKTVARFIASKSKKSAHFLSPGDFFDVLIAECRYVRPIKGDKLGRVNYTHEKVLRCKM